MTQTNIFDEIIVDNFAGGGGASTGMELAAGRPVAIAINHDPDAILLHKTNHPYTEHLQASVWDVDPVAVCKGRPVGLAWFSPDCKHFSKAKGAPLVDRKIRGLSWVILRWAMTVRPRVIMMENVEEIKTWGPLMEIWIDGHLATVPDPDHKGETFDAFIAMLSTGVSADHAALVEACEFLQVSIDGPEAKRLIEGLGYEIEHRDLVAADYGAPTTRKRFALIARCDGKPIVWPERPHAPRDSEEVKSGKCLPWRSAAEIIDWRIPGYSIFATKEEIKKEFGVNAVRPLAKNTLRRVIRGVDKFTIRSGKPFLVECNHSGGGHISDLQDPLNTVTGKYTGGVCQPVVAPIMVQQKFSNQAQDITKPLTTVTAVGAHELAQAVMAPITITNTSNSVGAPADQPVHTVTTAGNQILASAQLISIGQTGGGDRIRDIREPAPTTVSKQEACVVAANLIQYHTEQTENVRASGLDIPIQTVDASNRYGLTCANLVEYYGNGNPLDVAEPMHTATSHDREAVVSAHVVKFKGQELGQHPTDTLNTITAQGLEYADCRTVLVQVDDCANLGNWPKVRELLNEHCGYQLAEDELLLLVIGGTAYFIANITLRMLTPRELYNAMGFPEDYVIDRDYLGHEYKKNKQVARCGNAVCPPMAYAMVWANFPEWQREKINAMAQFHDAVAV